MKSILITGGTGLIGSALSNFLFKLNYKVFHLSRKKKSTSSGYKNYYWDVENNQLDYNILKNKDIIIHLAGEPIAKKRWTKKQKSIINNSRILSTSLLYESIKKLDVKPQLIIAASAIAIYPHNTSNKMTENNQNLSSNFLVNVVKNWEKEIKKFSKIGIRLVIIRIGVVLSLKGGMLGKLFLPFKLGLGFPIGSGNQTISWIHIEDLNRMINHFIQHKNLNGTFNAVSPVPVSNSFFSKTFSQLLMRDFFFNIIRIPSFIIRLFYGEMSDLILKGYNVSSAKITNSNFRFKHENIREAILDLLKRKV